MIKLPAPFGNTVTFTLHEISRYDDRGPAWYWNDISTGEHTGTHFDAPVHWATGRDGEDVSQVPVCQADRSRGRARLHRRRPPLTRTSCSRSSTSRPWEAEHGSLPDGGWMLYRTGWDTRSGSQQEFLNASETGPHTPGRVGGVRPLAGEESPVLGIGPRPSAPTPAPRTPSTRRSRVTRPCSGRQVRSDPAAEPGPAAGHRSDSDRRPASDRRRLWQPVPGACAGGAFA